MADLDLKQDREGYKTAFKTTALFGSVQVVNILVSILKSKIVALWLGSVGFGIMSLFNSAISLIYSVTNLGLQDSAVRDIAYAAGQNDKALVAKTVKGIKRWVLSTGLLGVIVTIVLSPLLSQWVFDSNQYVRAFIILSCVVLLMGIYNGNYAILQGIRNLGLMAKANIFGSVAGFLCSLPMFYFFRQDGIVLALMLTALATAVVSWIYLKKAKVPNISLSCSDTYRIGLKAIKLGSAMSLSGISVVLVQFAVKTFIARDGDIAEVGLYQAGWALNGTYLGLVFTAMAKDYYPRLSQVVSADNEQIKVMMNQQTEIALLILAPLIIIMIVFMPFFINLLYSAEFVGIVAMTEWLLIGSLIKAGSWAISFVFLAKGNGRVFLFNELGIKCITLPSYLFGFHLFGLNGIGYAYTLNYLIYFIWVAVVAYRLYGIFYSMRYWRLFLILLLSVLVFPLGRVLWDAGYGTGIILIICILAYSVYELNRRIELKTLFRSIFGGKIK